MTSAAVAVSGVTVSGRNNDLLTQCDIMIPADVLTFPMKDRLAELLVLENGYCQIVVSCLDFKDLSFLSATGRNKHFLVKGGASRYRDAIARLNLSGRVVRDMTFDDLAGFGHTLHVFI